MEYVSITATSRSEHMDLVAAAIGDLAGQGELFRTPIALSPQIVAAGELCKFGPEGLTPDMFMSVTTQALHGNGLQMASPGSPWQMQQPLPALRHQSIPEYLKGMRLMSDYVSVRICPGLPGAGSRDSPFRRSASINDRPARTLPAQGPP